VGLVPAGSTLVGAAAGSGVAQVLDRTVQVDNGTRVAKRLESIFILIRVFAVVLAVVVLYSLGSLAFTERVRDYATLSVLGFGGRQLRRLVGRENIVMTTIGLVLGVPAGLWFLSVYVTMFDRRDIAYYPTISPVSIGLAVGITAISALTTTILLRRRVRSINMVEALKGVE
jgi:putative ABC transport system permease protein